MKSILLKIDDELFKEIESSAKEFKTSKTALMKKAFETFVKVHRDKKIEAQLAKESFLVRENSMKVNLEFESTLSDGLND